MATLVNIFYIESNVAISRGCAKTAPKEDGCVLAEDKTFTCFCSETNCNHKNFQVVSDHAHKGTDRNTTDTRTVFPSGKHASLDVDGRIVNNGVDANNVFIPLLLSSILAFLA